MDKYVLAYQAERHEKELKRFVISSHISFEEWRKKNENISIASEVFSKKEEESDEKKEEKGKKGKKEKKEKKKIKEEEGKGKEEKGKEKEKEKEKKSEKPIPFPPECTIPINAVSLRLHDE